MKIALFDAKHWDKEHLASLFQSHELVMRDYSLQEEDLSSVRDAEALIVFISSKVTREVLEQFPNLKLVATMSTGFDHVDLQACGERGVTVCNVPFYGENTVAEHAFALLLAIARKIPQAVQRVREENFSVEGLEGFDLAGKTIGVIGTGHIGIHAVKIAKGFGMNVLAFDVYPREDAARELGFRYASMDELLSSSDVITLHVPYNKHTHHLLDRDAFSKVKRGAVLINTSRGGVVDTKALLWALDSGVLKAAGLDVLEGEHLIGKRASSEEERELLELNEKLLEMENVLITPHNAFNTREALARIEKATFENVEAFLKGSPVNVVKQ